ncbi:hypothetical protein H4582DRAFT_1529979 [Lactarius indigo]|nr:hypothetical protein H4582DRAFT_1529979 [Lactarius indigo]
MYIRPRASHGKTTSPLLSHLFVCLLALSETSKPSFQVSCRSSRVDPLSLASICSVRIMSAFPRDDSQSSRSDYLHCSGLEHLHRSGTTSASPLCSLPMLHSAVGLLAACSGYLRRHYAREAARTSSNGHPSLRQTTRSAHNYLWP